MKRAAEEGFIQAQHLVGIDYFQGQRCKKDDAMSLAWFRQSIRNGNVVSYLNAGDILSKGGNNVQQNRLFGLVNYVGAYRYGAFFLKDRIKEVIEELKTIEGETLPEFKFLEIDPDYLESI